MKKQLVVGLEAGLILALTSGMAMAIPYTGADIELLGNETSARESDNNWRDLANGAIGNPYGDEWIEYTAYLTVGSWNVGLNVTNFEGYLGTDGWYPFFEIGINEDPNYSLNITASDTEVFFGFINVDIASAGDYTVRYTWLNDQNNTNIEPHRDANLEVTTAFFDQVAPNPVPEPATMLLFGTGLIGLAGCRLRKNR